MAPSLYDVLHVGMAVTSQQAVSILGLLGPQGVGLLPLRTEGELDQRLVLFGPGSKADVVVGGRPGQLVMTCVFSPAVHGANEALPSLGEFERAVREAEAAVAALQARLKEWVVAFRQEHGRPPAGKVIFASPVYVELAKEQENVKKAKIRLAAAVKANQ